MLAPVQSHLSVDHNASIAFEKVSSFASLVTTSYSGYAFRAFPNWVLQHCFTSCVLGAISLKPREDEHCNKISLSHQRALSADAEMQIYV